MIGKNAQKWLSLLVLFLAIVVFVRIVSGSPPGILDWLIGILFLLIASTELIRRFVKNSETFYLASMLRFKKPIEWIDKLAVHPKILNLFADLGLIVGFGGIAADYILAQKYKLSPIKRIALFLVSGIILSQVLTLFFPLDNPIIPSNPVVLQASFGIFGFAGLILSSLVYSALDIVAKLSTGINACAGVAPVIPGVELPNSPIVVPLHAWISFVIILVIHEGMHGVLSRKSKIPIKSTGILLAGIFPIGAFVEPDDVELKKLEKRSPLEALRMYAAGPMANFTFFIFGTVLFFLIGSFLIAPLTTPYLMSMKSQQVTGLEIQSVEDFIEICGTTFPAPAHGILAPGMGILEVDGKHVQFISDYIKEISGKKEFTLTVDANGAVSQHTFKPNELGRLGITLSEKQNPAFTPPFEYVALVAVLGILTSFFGWLVLLNLLVAIANFIPVDPFDGGKMVKLLLMPYFGSLKMSQEQVQKLIGRAFAIVLVVLIILNAAPLIIVH